MTTNNLLLWWWSFWQINVNKQSHQACYGVCYGTFQSQYLRQDQLRYLKDEKSLRKCKHPAIHDYRGNYICLRIVIIESLKNSFQTDLTVRGHAIVDVKNNTSAFSLTWARRPKRIVNLNVLNSVTNEQSAKKKKRSPLDMIKTSRAAIKRTFQWKSLFSSFHA